MKMRKKGGSLAERQGVSPQPPSAGDTPGSSPPLPLQPPPKTFPPQRPFAKLRRDEHSPRGPAGGFAPGTGPGGKGEGRGRGEGGGKRRPGRVLSARGGGQEGGPGAAAAT